MHTGFEYSICANSCCKEPKANTEKDYNCETANCPNLITEDEYKTLNGVCPKCSDSYKCTMKTCLSADCDLPIDGDSDYCFDHKHNIIEKGKELNKTLEPSDATNSNDKDIDNNTNRDYCKRQSCNNESTITSNYCEDHKPKKKYRYRCGECSKGYTKTMYKGYCSKTCNDKRNSKHE